MRYCLGLTGIMAIYSLGQVLLAEERGIDPSLEMGIPNFDGKRYALILANSDYSHWDKLPGVQDDVVRYQHLLESLGYEVTVKQNLKRSDFQKVMDNFFVKVGVVKDNQIIVVYAGHGTSMKGAGDKMEGYLVLVDTPLYEESDPTSLEEFWRSAIPIKEMSAWAGKFKSTQMLMIFDSCFAGTIFTGDRGLPPGSPQFDKPVRQVITAGDHNQTVPDQSIFREHLEVGVSQNLADSNRDGLITGYELGSYLQWQVSSDTRSHQNPQSGKIADGSFREGEFLVKAYDVDACSPGAATRPALGKRCINEMRRQFDATETAARAAEPEAAWQHWKDWLDSYQVLNLPQSDYGDLMASARGRELGARMRFAGLEFAPIPGTRVEMSLTETTVAQYTRCVLKGPCSLPTTFDENKWCHYGQPGAENFSINCVTLAQAQTYAGWLGARLPTQEEWTLAAGTVPVCSTSWMASGQGGEPWTTGCGTRKPREVMLKSRGGFSDLYGNLWEWTCAADDEGNSLVVGGAWDTPAQGAPSSYVKGLAADTRGDTITFRLVREIP